ncbi:MAG TPA: hypothetical protein VE422_10190 [Terriglobia bacterium]|nr:hypothetical protein [Terriglobia bacterium]
MARIIKPLFQCVKFLRFEFDAMISACRTATSLGSGASHISVLADPRFIPAAYASLPLRPDELERVGTRNKRLVFTEISHDNVSELFGPIVFHNAALRPASNPKKYSNLAGLAYPRTERKLSFAAEVLADNPIAYYRFGEAAGATSVSDLSG